MDIDKSSKEMRKVLLVARSMMDLIIKTDADEAEFRQMIEQVFQSLMGYAPKHITREHRMHGSGDSDYGDFAIQIERGNKMAPTIIIEVEKGNLELAEKRMKQLAPSAVNIGCEWAILTNGREWRIYHIPFSQPPQTILLDSWNLMTDDLSFLANKFEMISYKNVKCGSLEQLWLKSDALTPQNLLKIILSTSSIDLIHRELTRKAKTSLYPEEIIGGIRRLLNESAVAELENIKINVQDKGKTIGLRKTDAASTDKTPDGSLISFNAKPE